MYIYVHVCLVAHKCERKNFPRCIGDKHAVRFKLAIIINAILAPQGKWKPF